MEKVNLDLICPRCKDVLAYLVDLNSNKWITLSFSKDPTDEEFYRIHVERIGRQPLQTNSEEMQKK